MKKRDDYILQKMFEMYLYDRGEFRPECGHFAYLDRSDTRGGVNVLIGRKGR